MANVVYWANSGNGDSLSDLDDTHYLRLGTYDAGNGEPEAAEKKLNDVAEGVFFYTTNVFSMKSTDAYHQEVSGPVKRKIESGSYTYENSGGDFSVDTAEGGISLKASKKVSIVSTENNDDTSNPSIHIDAGSSRDIFITCNHYYKETDERKTKTVKADYYKSNLVIVVKTALSVALSTTSVMAIGYKSGSVGVRLGENSNKAVGVSFYGSKSTLVPTNKIGIYFIDKKKTVLDEEYCFFKNETKLLKVDKGWADFKSKKAAGAVSDAIANSGKNAVSCGLITLFTWDF